VYLLHPGWFRIVGGLFDGNCRVEGGFFSTVCNESCRQVGYRLWCCGANVAAVLFGENVNAESVEFFISQCCDVQGLPFRLDGGDGECATVSNGYAVAGAVG
jgi:hypothetical protein